MNNNAHGGKEEEERENVSAVVKKCDGNKCSKKKCLREWKEMKK